MPSFAAVFSFTTNMVRMSSWCCCWLVHFQSGIAELVGLRLSIFYFVGGAWADGGRAGRPGVCQSRRDGRPRGRLVLVPWGIFTLQCCCMRKLADLRIKSNKDSISQRRDTLKHLNFSSLNRNSHFRSSEQQQRCGRGEHSAHEHENCKPAAGGSARGAETAGHGALRSGFSQPAGGIHAPWVHSPGPRLLCSGGDLFLVG